MYSFRTSFTRPLAKARYVTRPTAQRRWISPNLFSTILARNVQPCSELL